jgi:hypothetical protein
MKFSRRTYQFVLFIILFSSIVETSYASFTGRLVSVILHSKVFHKELQNFGLKQTESFNMSVSLKRSLKGLNNNKTIGDGEELMAIINKLPAETKSEIKMVRKLKWALAEKRTESNPWTKEEVLKVYNQIHYLAARFPSSTKRMLYCSLCVGDSLKGHGVTGQMIRVTHEKTKLALESLPQNTRELNRLIKREMKSQNWGDLKSSNVILSQADKHDLGLFLLLEKMGSQQQKKLIQTIRELSFTQTGESHLIKNTSRHLFWKIFSKDYSDYRLNNLNLILLETLELAKSNRMASKDAFFAVLEKKSLNNPQRLEKLEDLKRNGCFWN